MKIDWTEIRTVQLIHALASTLGIDKSRHAVRTACDELGMASEVLSKAQALMLLDHIAQTDGIVGVTARFVRLRIECGRSLPSAPPPADSVPPPSGRVSLVDAEPFVLADSGMAMLLTRRTLSSLLSGTLGQELADTCVNETADALKLPRDWMSQEQASSLLDTLGERQGIVGVTARFARARMQLRQAG